MLGALTPLAELELVFDNNIFFSLFKFFCWISYHSWTTRNVDKKNVSIKNIGARYKELVLSFLKGLSQGF